MLSLERTIISCGGGHFGEPSGLPAVTHEDCEGKLKLQPLALRSCHAEGEVACGLPDRMTVRHGTALTEIARQDEAPSWVWLRGLCYGVTSGRPRSQRVLYDGQQRCPNRAVASQYRHTLDDGHDRAGESGGVRPGW